MREEEDDDEEEDDERGNMANVQRARDRGIQWQKDQKKKDKKEPKKEENQERGEAHCAVDESNPT